MNEAVFNLRLMGWLDLYQKYANKPRKKNNRERKEIQKTIYNTWQAVVNVASYY